MSIQSVWQTSFDFVGEKPVVVEPSQARISTDAGLLPIRQYDAHLGLTEQFAAALNDPRHQPFTDHTVLEMVRTRIYGIQADYPDQNDHDTLRRDAVFKLVADRSPEDPDLAGQSTLSRFENAVDIPSLWRLRDVFIEQFIASFETPPARLTLDMDVFDDPTHGRQQLSLFHGHYKQYQYEPRVLTCAETGTVVMASLLYGTAHASLGAADDLEYLVARLRQVWPDVEIRFRADSGFAVPALYEACERLEVADTIGIKMNPVLKDHSAELLEQAREDYRKTGTKQRPFCGFWYQAGSWSWPRWTVVKCEAHARGTNRRAVLTNRPGAQVLPGAAYDEYTQRGESSENRNKELKCGLQADRLSDHRYLANYFRLYLHCAALNLHVRLREEIADPPPRAPVEERSAKEGRDYANRRREHDPLGGGQPATWRTRLIKVAAEITVSARRILVRLSGSWPYLEHFRRVSDHVLKLSSRPPPAPG